MKYLLGLMAVLPLCYACSQEKPVENTRYIVDYQGKELTEQEIDSFFQKELAHFEAIKQDTSVKVEKINDVKGYLQTHFKKSPSGLNIENLDSYNMDLKLFTPFREGDISLSEFLGIIDTLKDGVKQSVSYHFAHHHFPQIKEHPELLEKVLAIDEELRKGRDGFRIRLMQDVEKYKDAIEDSINNDAFYQKRYPQAGMLLSRIASLNDHKKTLTLLNTAIDKLPLGVPIRGGDELNVFEYLTIYGNDSIKQVTKDLLFKYLEKVRFSSVSDYRALIRNEASEDFKAMVAVKKNSLDTIKDPETRLKQEERFQQYYLSHYTRTHGMAALAYVKPLLKIDEQYIRYNEDDSIHYRVTKYSVSADVERALEALKTLAQYTSLDPSKKQEVMDVVKEADLLRAESYFWIGYMDIIKALYPDKSYNDFAALFEIVPDRARRYSTPEAYWHKKIYDPNDLDVYLDYLNGLGIDTDHITAKDRFVFHKMYGTYDGEVMLWGVLGLAKISLNYDCETGQWPNPYDELMLQYLSLCKADLPDYAVKYKYEKLNDDYDTKYTAVLHNEKQGYVIHPGDFGDWYDPISVEAAFNQALRDQGTDKRFVQIDTGDQTVLTVYCNPGQLKLFANKFGLPILHEQRYGER
ncbi:MAG: hypothetical protein AAFX87_25355 [Bacteroidota bacterium]